MIASKLDKLDLSGNQPVISRTLDDIAKDIRKYLSGAVESVIKAGQALQEGRDMHPSNIDFHNWCTKEFPDLNSKMRERMMQVGRRFDTTFMSQRLPVTVLYELAAPSVPDELVEDIISSDKPVKVKEVQEAKKGYKAVQEDESNADLKEKVESKEIKPVDAAKIANKRAEDAVLEFNSLSNEQKIAHLGIPKIVDQKKLDETLEEDFNPINAATGILISLNRLRIFGGRKEIERNILGVLNNTVRMQSYEAEALILLADIVNENREEIKSMYETKRNLKTIN